MPHKVLTFDLRHPPQFATTGPELYAAALDIIAWAEEQGFRRVALGEHHQSPDGYLPAPLVFASAVGGRTKKIRVQVSVLLAPLYHPVRLAEEIAVADLCLGGRLEPAIAAGYVEEDFGVFGADYHRRGKTMEELVPFLRQAWTGEPFEYQGRTVRVTPKPAQDPMRIFMGGGRRPAIERAVRLADGFIAPGGPEAWTIYREVSVELGKPDPGEYPTTGPMFVWVTTEDKAKVYERLAPHIAHQVDSYSAWTRAAFGESEGPYVAAPDDDPLSGRGNYQILDPEEAIELGNRLGRRGWMMFNPLMAGIDPAEAWKMLHTAEERVFPYLDG
jgi:alkanesulfonate monooxygenase SsuD/methylene tetrahydromethanopterin reductase-like flavin-dependent oxidoreductase (luciferase family)